MEYADRLENYMIPATEEFIFNETPLFINYDKWVNGESNILYITGLSGSGKGYYAKQVAKTKENSIILELDKFENYQWYVNNKEDNPSVAKGDKIIYKYLNDNYDLSYDIFNNDVVKYNQMMKDFYKYIMQYIKEHRDIPFIMEGIQIFCDDAFRDISSNDSVIIIRTSTVKSMRKVMDREHNTIRNHLHTFIDAQKKLKDFENRLNASKVSVATESSLNTNGFKFSTPEELLKWMSINIKYSKFTRLKDPMTVLINKEGSCHDQTVFELFFLNQMGISANALFLLETNLFDKGGVTHSFAYYKSYSKYYWLENVWDSFKGIHEYSSIDKMISDIKRMHEKGMWGDYKKFPFVKVCPFNYQIGDTLQMLVNRMYKPM